MGHVIERLHKQLRTRRDRYARMVVVSDAATPSQRHELEAIFQRAGGSRAA